MKLIDLFIEEYRSDPDYRSQLVTIAHLAVLLLSIIGFEHWSHWWFLLSAAVCVNFVRLSWVAIAAEAKNDREVDEFIRRHYRL